MRRFSFVRGHMAVFRVNKDKNYTTVNNTLVRDKFLSLKAKGLLLIMLSLPDEWDYSISGLAAICKEGRTAIEEALKELKENGYLIVEKLPPEKGTRNNFEYVYNIYEVPSSHREQGAGNLPLENHEQLNTNKSIREESCFMVDREKESENKESDCNKTEIKGRFRKPTLEEVRDYINEKGYSIDPENFYDYYESVGWQRGRSRMKDWKATIRNWNSREKKSKHEIVTEYDDLF